MSVALAADIWNLVKDAVPYDDRAKLAAGLVSILIDHGYDTGDIAYEFNDDADVVDSVSYYSDDTDSDFEEDDDDSGDW